MSVPSTVRRTVPPSIKAGVLLYALTLAASAAQVGFGVRYAVHRIGFPTLGMPTSAGHPASTVSSAVMTASVAAPFVIMVFVLWVLPALFLYRIVFARRWATTALAGYTTLFVAFGLISRVFEPSAHSALSELKAWGLPVLQVVAVTLLFLGSSDRFWSAART